MKNFFNFILIAIIFTSSLFFRLYALKNVKYEMQYDLLNYHNSAVRLIEDGYFAYVVEGKMDEQPNAYTTPGYSLFLATVYRLAGSYGSEGINIVKTVQVVLSAATVILIYLIGSKIHKSVGIIASLLAMLYPAFMVVSTLHLTETVYLFLFMTYIFFQIDSFERKNRFEHLITGIIFAMTVMVRPGVFFFPFMIYAYKIIKNREVLKYFFFFAIGVILIMLPWWIRNYIVLGKFVLFCTQMGNPVLGGVYPPQFAPRSYPQVNQIEEAIRVLTNGFANYPKEYLHWFIVEKPRIIFEQVYLIALLPSMKVLIPIHFFVLAFGTIGSIISFAKKQFRLLPFFAIAITISQLMVIPEARYAFSVMPFLMLLTGYTIYKICNCIAKK